MINKLTRGAVAALIAVTLLLPFNKVTAAIPVGSWRAHPSYNDATLSIKAFGCIFVLSDGAIYLYDTADEGIYTIDKTGGLGDTDISAMGYCDNQKAIILVYSNGNIDILYDDFTIYNFTDLKNGGTVSVNELKVIGNIAYISTDNGLVLFDIARREIKNTYRFDKAVKTSVIMNDTVICGTDDGLYLGVMADNLLDKSNWTLFSSAKFNELFLFDNTLSGYSQDNVISSIDRTTAATSNVTDGVTGINLLSDNRLAVIKDTAVCIYDNYSVNTRYDFHNHINNIISDGNNLWTAEGLRGLCRYSLKNDTVICNAQMIKPNSPRRNWFHSVSWPQDGRLLVVGGCHNYMGITYPGTVMIYENDRWSYLPEDLNTVTGLSYENLTDAVQDPSDPGHIFVGSTGQGLYEFRNYQFYKLHTWNNSGLTSIINNTEFEKNIYVRVSALQYDRYGNLWMANNERPTVIKVMEPDGNWFGLYYAELDSLPTFKQLTFDRNNPDKFWINSSRHKPGIACIDTKGTIKNNSDDVIKFSGGIFMNQDGVNEEIYFIYCYEFDQDGDMWIGTDKGIFVLRDPDNYINQANPVFERIKIPRNDGSDLADYLFNGVMTTAIFIDQGNRKWIGTYDQGVFLLSADGTETLEHFTTSNSPLPSDNILTITDDGRNGSVFFGTNLGLVEYGGQARDPEESLSESKILVYPNPVKPEYDGYVTITGLTENSTIRIMSNSGRLIHQAKSNGGSYSWNLTDMNGKQVSSGVYHAIITNLENSKSTSTSITVIR